MSGADKLFYFILGHYVERTLQYGLVHTDLTPRPAYIAFAAVGRLFNGAKPLGRVNFGDDKLKGLFLRRKLMVRSARRWWRGAKRSLRLLKFGRRRRLTII